MKLVVIAPRGKMGSAIVRVAAAREGLELVAGVGAPGGDYIGRDLGEVALTGRALGAPVVENLETVIEGCDAVIDFSVRKMAPVVLESALRHQKALVCGTTGLSEEEINLFQAASKRIPIVRAANTSRMVFLLNRFLETVSGELGDQVDVEILDMHDRWKLDAPSGTALELGRTIAGARGVALEDAAEYGRRGHGARSSGSIGFHSLRAGDIPSSHIVFLGGMGERLEIAQHSYNMDCFAHGACDCAAFLAGRPAGLYSVEDVFGDAQK